MILRDCIDRMAADPGRIFIQGDHDGVRQGAVFAAWDALMRCADADQGTAPPKFVILCRSRANGIALSVAAAFAGLDFAPMSWDVPQEKLHQALDQLPGAVIATDVHTGEENEALATANAPRLVFDAFSRGAEIGQETAEACVARTAAPLGGRYIVFTSGSTGRPKGVPIELCKLEGLLHAFFRLHKIDPDDRWAQFSSPGFDLSILDMFAPLCAGATLVTLDRELERLMPALAIQRLGITVWHSVPSIFRSYRAVGSPEEGPLRLLLFCGEALGRGVIEGVRTQFPGARIFNQYGPSEATIFCSAAEVTNWQGGSAFAPIGMPIEGWEFALDPLEGIPDLGELLIRSRNICSGYLGIDSPAFRFLDEQESDRAPVIEYRSGDLVRRCPEGYSFVQRLDDQVKINGVRIELQDINSAFEEIFEAPCCTLWLGGAAHLFVETNRALDLDAARRIAARRIHRSTLPEIHAVLQLPRLDSAKIDRSALINLLKTPCTENAPNDPFGDTCSQRGFKNDPAA